jgi:histidine ammonia-lyase
MASIKPAADINLVAIDGENLSLDDVVSVARKKTPVVLSEIGKAKLKTSRSIIENVLETEQVVYGVTTGFGKFSDVFISPDDSSELQMNIIKSHAGGVGEPLPQEVVRAMMLLRANSLTKGYSGVRIELVELLVEMLNNGIHPVVPSKGSVGASGDLVPLAHVALSLIGLGDVEYNGKIMPAREALKHTHLKPVILLAKEGLALINGTQYMSALGCLAVHDAVQLIKLATITSCLTVEALEGIPSAYDPKIHQIRPHSGQIRCAAAMRMMLAEGDLVRRKRHKRVQDAYTLRCIPQVHGASLDAVNYVISVLETEINSATDNPLIFPETGEVISGGNFHGQPLALALDFLAMAVAEIGNISERRIERLVNPALSGLPPFLTEHGGLNSGLMIAQYTAASLVSENKVLSHPASVDSIPTSANQEDHVSMGSVAALKARSVIENVKWILSAEFLASCQGIDFAKHQLGRGTRVAYNQIRERVSHWENDRPLYIDLNQIHKLVFEENVLLGKIEEELGTEIL